MSLAKYIIAGLASAASISALPQQHQQHQSSMTRDLTMATSFPASNSTASGVAKSTGTSSVVDSLVGLIEDVAAMASVNNSSSSSNSTSSMLNSRSVGATVTSLKATAASIHSRGPAKNTAGVVRDAYKAGSTVGGNSTMSSGYSTASSGLSYKSAQKPTDMPSAPNGGPMGSTSSVEGPSGQGRSMGSAPISERPTGNPPAGGRPASPDSPPSGMLSPDGKPLGSPSAGGKPPGSPSAGGGPPVRPSAPSLPSVVAPSASPVNSAAVAAAAASNAALAKKVLADVTNVNRFNELLTVDGLGKQILDPVTLKDRVVFDFNKKIVPQGDGGLFVLANENNFPILVEQGISTAVAVLNPCSMNSPHTHPRATEWLTVVDGTLEAGFMLENGFLANPATGALTTEISSSLSAFQGTIFPMGSIHFQFNPTCKPATFIATLNSADPGTSQVAQNFFFLDDEIVDITLGENVEINGLNIDQFRNTLPPNLVQAVDTCLQRCGQY